MITATYCPEDNKLRLYSGWLDRETFDALRATGYKPTPKQDCDFVATWSLAAEDMALSLIDPDDDIGDEDQSPEDRAADRAERFAGYRDKRSGEAHGHADAYDAAPSAAGNQSAARAARLAARRDRYGRNACTQWSKAEYWQHRTAGVIRNALYKSDARVRRGRLLRLESELADAERKLSRCYHCSNNGAQALRVVEHLRSRVAYERAMLEEQGGVATDAPIEVGGHFGRYQVLRVNKSPKTGKPVSVQVLAPKPWHRGPDPAPLTLQTLNIQRLGEETYRPPTDEDREQARQALAEVSNKRKATNAGKPKLINPTDEDAERLQSHLNVIARRRWEQSESRHYGNPPASVAVSRMTQAAYSARSKGVGTAYATEWLGEDGRLYTHENPIGIARNVPKIAKVRTAPNGARSFYAADSVVVITDKPQKPLPAWRPLTEAVQS